MKKKHTTWALIALAAALVFGVAGCGGSKEKEASAQTGEASVTAAPDQQTGDNGADKTGDNANEEEFYFLAGSSKVKTDMDVSEAALPESKSVFEAPSCAGEGVDYIYDFGSYEIETYPAADGKDRIGFITLRDDTVATPEGIDLSMTKADVLRVYGNDCEESAAMLSYRRGNTKLNFILNGDLIISIQYISVALG